jgi:hypothetical protein
MGDGGYGTSNGFKKYNCHPADPPSVKFFLDIAPFGALEQKLQI